MGVLAGESEDALPLWLLELVEVEWAAEAQETQEKGWLELAYGETAKQATALTGPLQQRTVSSLLPEHTDPWSNPS